MNQLKALGVIMVIAAIAALWPMAPAAAAQPASGISAALDTPCDSQAANCAEVCKPSTIAVADLQVSASLSVPEAAPHNVGVPQAAHAVKSSAPPSYAGPPAYLRYRHFLL